MFPRPIGARTGRIKMPDTKLDNKDTATDKVKQPHADERMEDEEKIMAGRHDVNYPAHLTKDVPGG